MNKKNKEIVIGFWNQHFKYVDTTTTIIKEKTINLFHKLHGNEINHQVFTIISGQIGVKGKKARNGKLFIAISSCAKNHYQKIEKPLLDGKQLETPRTEGKQLETTMDEEENNNNLEHSEYQLIGAKCKGSKRKLNTNGQHQKISDKPLGTKKIKSYEYKVNRNIIINNNTEPNVSRTLNTSDNKVGKYMDKTKTSRSQKVLNKGLRVNVDLFWKTHYKTNLMDQLYNVDDIFNFFQTTNFYNGQTLQDFKTISGTIIDIPAVKVKTRTTTAYRTNPISRDSMNYHNKLSNTGKQKAKATPSQKGKIRNSRDNTHKFWKTHYEMDNIDRVITAADVFYFFQTTKWFSGHSYTQFVFESTQIITLIFKRSRTSNETLYKVCPKTRPCMDFHTRDLPNITSLVELPEITMPLSTHTESKTITTNTITIDLYLVNIQGLITNHTNKCPFLRTVTNRGSNKQKIIAITETWADQHYDAEFKAHMNDHNVLRADRTLVKNTQDVDQLSSRGGVMILTTNDIPITPILQFSNGNCEVLIAEIQIINTAIIVMYRPSGKNFSVNKFNEAINKVQEYLKQNYEKSNLDIHLMGDFNFPPNIVTWVKSDNGLIASYIEGGSDKKMAFETLITITEESALEQIIDKPTRKNNILDLLFTNNAAAFSACEVIDIYPISDHNLVKLELTINGTQPNAQDERDLLNDRQSAAKLNFKQANKEELKKRTQ